MSEHEPVGWLRITADTVVSTEPVLLYGVIFLTSVTGGDVTIYNGQDAASGSQFARLEGTANVTNSFSPAKAILLDMGLFVDVGSNVTEVVVIYDPLVPYAD